MPSTMWRSGTGDRLVPAGQRLAGAGDLESSWCERYSQIRSVAEPCHSGGKSGCSSEIVTGRETMLEMKVSAPPTVPSVTTGASATTAGALARLYTRVLATREPLERSLIGRMVLRFDIIDGSDRAAVLALNALLSLIPLAVLGVAVAHVYGVTSGNYADGLVRRPEPARAHRDGTCTTRRRASTTASAARPSSGIGGLLWTAFGFTERALARLRPRVGRPQPRRPARVAARVRLADPVRGQPHDRRASREATWDTARPIASRARAAARARIRRLARLALAAARTPAALARRRAPARP